MNHQMALLHGESALYLVGHYNLDNSRNDIMCSIKCTQMGWLAFHVDKTSKECKLGSVVVSSGDNATWIDVYRKLDENGAPALLGK